jgi:hypothetical protein
MRLNDAGNSEAHWLNAFSSSLSYLGNGGGKRTVQ